MNPIKVLFLAKDNKGTQQYQSALSQGLSPKIQVEYLYLPLASRDSLVEKMVDLLLIDIEGLAEDELVNLSQFLSFNPGIPILILTTTEEDSLPFKKEIKDRIQDSLPKSDVTPPLIDLAIRYAVDRYNLEQKLLTSSISDELTGLYNRHGFITLAEQQIRLADRLKKGMLFFYLDIKGLKTINDSFGYQAGNQAIQDAAEILRLTFRKSDIIARVAGDEFAVLAIESQAEEINTILARLNDTLNSINDSRQTKQPLTFHVGISQWTQQTPKSLDSLFQEAEASIRVQKEERQSHPAGQRDLHQIAAQFRDISPQQGLIDLETKFPIPEAILLVEDNPADARLIKANLNQNRPDTKLTNVSRLSEAFEQIDAQDYNLILLDLTLPDSHGLTTLTDIATKAPNTPIIILTGNDDLKLAKKALKLGAQDYLPKSTIDESILNRTIQFAIERHKLRSQNLLYSQQLQLSEARFRQIVEENNDALLILNNNQEILLANRAAHTLFDDLSPKLLNKQLDLSLGTTTDNILTIPQGSDPPSHFEIHQVEIPWKGQIASLLTLRDVSERERTKHALKSSEERLTSIFNNIAIGMYRTTPEGKILFANHALVQILGCESLEELKQWDLEEKSDWQTYDRSEFKKTMEKEHQIVGHKSIWHKADGSPIYIRESATAVCDVDGRILYYEGTAEDITSQVEAEGRVRLQAAALDAAANAILITDRSGKILWCNPAFYDLTGYSLQEVQGQNISILNSEEQDLEYYQSMWETVQKGMVWQGTLTNRRKNGSTYNEEMTITPLRGESGEITHFIAIKQDITARRLSEERLQRQLKELWLLNQVALIGIEELDEDSLIDRVTQLMVDSFYPDHCGVLILDESGKILNLHPSYRGISSERWPKPIGIDEGVVGPVVTSGKSRRIPDVSKVPEFIHATEGIQSCLAVPLSLGGDIIGVINAESKQCDAFSAEDERLLITVAGQLAIAIEQIRKRRAENEQRRMAEALRDSAMAINSSLSIDEVLDQILENIQQVIAYSAASVMLNENNSTRVQRHRGYDLSGNTDLITGVSFELKENQKYQTMITTREPCIIPDIRQEPEWVFFPDIPWVRSHLSVVIAKDNKTYGFINLDHSEVGFFKPSHGEALKTLAHQLAIALENASLYEESQQRAAELSRLYHASETLIGLSPSNLQAMGESIVNSILSDFGKSNCSLFLVQPGKKVLLRLAAAGPYLTDLGEAVQLHLDGPGLVSKSIRTGKLINALDVNQHPEYVRNWKEAASEMAVPLVASGNVIGAIDIQSRNKNAFNADDERIVSVFAERAALTLENARLYQEQQRQLAFLESLRQIDLAITSTMDMSITLDLIIKQIQTQLRVDAISILLFDPYVYTLNTIASTGFTSREAQKTQVRIGEGLAGYVAQKTQPLFEPDLQHGQYPQVRGQIFLKEGFHSYYGIPLLAKGEVKGVLELLGRHPMEITPDLENFTSTVATQTAIAIDNAMMFETLQQSHTEITMAYDTTLEGWAKALELRDHETVGHARRVVELTMTLARKMGVKGDDLTHIRRGALLHDIGKMGIPDSILQNTGNLTEEEWEIMRKHPSYAYEWLNNINYLRPALAIPYCHHEKWDGSGYPQGLQGDQIPLAARIFAIVDVWDALCSKRPYREAWTPEKALSYIQENAGRHFDPKVVDVFVQAVTEADFPRGQNDSV